MTVSDMRNARIAMACSRIARNFVATLLALQEMKLVVVPGARWRGRRPQLRILRIPQDLFQMIPN